MERRNKLLLLFILIFITLFTTAEGEEDKQVLTCYCNLEDYCPNKTCQTEGYCYAHVEEVYEEGNYQDVHQYGCLAPNESGLMQCRSQNTPHSTPQNITCCTNYDYCNANLTPIYIRRRDQIWPTSWLLYYVIGFVVLLIGSLIIYLMRSLRRFNKGQKLAFESCPSVSSDIKKENLSIDESTMREVSSGEGDVEMAVKSVSKQIELCENGLIGRGRFGNVYKGNLLGTPVAVKVFSSTEFASFEHEKNIYDKCLKNHENILGYLAADIASHNGGIQFWLITHYCKYLSLYEFLTHNDEIITESQGLNMMHSIAEGLDYLHRATEGCGELIKPRIAHRDIKSKNILMKTKSVCCIADFGHAVIQLSENEIKRVHSDLRVGTKRYMAPEVLDLSMNPNKFENYAWSDIYQLALVMYEICNRMGFEGKYILPYGDIVPADPSFEDMIEVVCYKNYRPPLRVPTSTTMVTLNDIIRKCWGPNGASRLYAQQIKRKLKEIQETHSPLPILRCSSSSGYGSGLSDEGVAL